MSFHILHILTHGSRLFKKRGSLIFTNEKENINKQIPIEDIRAIVIAAKGITFSDGLLSSLLSKNVVILHCDDKFLPTGLSLPIDRVIHKETYLNQINSSQKFKKELWQKILSMKINNQMAVCHFLKIDLEYLEKNKSNESACARYYWANFFEVIFQQKIRRRKDSEHLANKMLNYAYTVLTSLIHRSVVIHGLSPVAGIHHAMNYHSHAFVYDLVEPFRSFIDLALAIFCRALIRAGKINKNLDEEEEEEICREWIKASQYFWKRMKIIFKNNRLKLVEAIDVYVNSVANVFKEKDLTKLWLPELTINEKEGELLKWVGYL